jgi:hypothetical protein
VTALQLVQILLPLTDNDGRAFAPGMFEALKDELAQRHGGVTAFVQAPAQGRWAPDGAVASEEDVVIFEVMVENLRADEWLARRRELERRFDQEHVIIRHMEIGLI